MAVPGIPQNVSIVGNTVVWDTVDGATSYNLYYLKDKCPNCYFNDLDDWTKNEINGTVIISENKASFDVSDNVAGAVDIIYDYLAGSGDYEITIDISDYVPDNINQGLNIEFRILSTENSDFVRVEFFQDNSSTFRGNGYAYFGGITQKNQYVDIGSMPTQYKITRTSTTLYMYYNIGSGWVQITNYDAGAAALNIEQIRLKAHHRVQNGGSVKMDNLIVTPSTQDNGTLITGITDTRYTFTGLTIDDFYCIVVTAVNDDGESDATDEVHGAIEDSTGYYTTTEIDHLLKAKEIDKLHTLQEMIPLYNSSDLASPYSIEDTGLLSAEEITQLHSATRLAEG